MNRLVIDKFVFNGTENIYSIKEMLCNKKFPSSEMLVVEIKELLNDYFVDNWMSSHLFYILLCILWIYSIKSKKSSWPILTLYNIYLCQMLMKHMECVTVGSNWKDVMISDMNKEISNQYLCCDLLIFPFFLEVKYYILEVVNKKNTIDIYYFRISFRYRYKKHITQLGSFLNHYLKKEVQWIYNFVDLRTHMVYEYDFCFFTTQKILLLLQGNKIEENINYYRSRDTCIIVSFHIIMKFLNNSTFLMNISYNDSVSDLEGSLEKDVIYPIEIIYFKNYPSNIELSYQLINNKTFTFP